MDCQSSVSLAYLLLVYRQYSASRHLAKELDKYLRFCATHRLTINRSSERLFSTSPGGREVPGFYKFLIVYERLGRPMLAAPDELSGQPMLGDYRLEELVYYWVWQHQYQQPDQRTRAISIGLSHWVLYLRRNGKSSLTLVELLVF